MEENSFAKEIHTLNKPWVNSANSIWLASTISLQRNIEKFKFPNKLDLERKKQIVNLVGKDLLNSEFLNQPKLLKAESLNASDKEYLAEHFFMIESFNQANLGEAFLIDATGGLATIFNFTDHINFFKLDTKGDLEEAWMHLVNIESALGKSLNYSFSQKFGFLTANFDECGTGLQVTTYLQLPALLHLEKIDTILEKEADENFMIMGIQGSPTEIIGDLFAIQNNYSIGQTEENILSSVRSLTSKLIAEEESARQTLIQTQNPLLIDKVSRAFGILLYSYQIEAVEALNAISLCKLGLALGWISGITIIELNHLFLYCRRAHLISQHSEKINPEEILHKRAEFIHKALKNVKLLV